MDGTKLAFVSHSAYNDEVWLMELRSGKRLLLSNQVSVKYKPVIHADGSRVMWDESGKGLYAVSPSGGSPEKLCEGCGWPWDWSRDRKRILHWYRGKNSVATEMVNLETGKRGVYLEHPGADLYQFRWSPDGRWIAFESARGGRAQVYAAPFTGDEGPGESTWIPITDGSTWEDKLNWSPDGNWIYALSDRDGFYCIWAYPIDSLTKRPAGKPQAVFHSHGARQSIGNANLTSQGVSVARDKIVFNQGEVNGNIWTTVFNPD